MFVLVFLVPLFWGMVDGWVYGVLCFANSISLFLFSVINLTKNSQLYVRQGDVERLISQGFLERLS